MTLSEKILLAGLGYLVVKEAMNTQPPHYNKWSPRTILIGDAPATILVGTDSYNLNDLFNSGISLYANQDTPVYDMSSVIYSTTPQTTTTSTGEQSVIYPIIAPPTSVLNTVPAGSLIFAPDGFDTIGNDIWFTVGSNPAHGFKYTPGGINSSALQAQQVQTTAQKAALSADKTPPWYLTFLEGLGTGIQRDILIAAVVAGSAYVISKAPDWYTAYERTHKKRAA